MNLINVSRPKLKLNITSGFREVSGTKWENLDFNRELINLKITKGNKERIVFFHQKLKEALNFYGIKNQGLIFKSQGTKN